MKRHFLRILLLIILISKSGNSQVNTIQEKIKKEREEAITKAVERVEKAVVSITCISTQYVREYSPFFEDPFFKEFFGELFPPRYYRQKIVSQGSGFIISRDGYILTNEHVIKGGDTIKVTLPDGRVFNAKLVGKDYKFDIALLKIEGKDFPSVNFGNSDLLRRGEWVVAFGNPFGYLWEDPQPTVTVGVVSALHRNFKGTEDRDYKNLIQTDAAINPGNSGGPLCDAEGNVIGMNTFIITKSGGFEGIGFAIPVNLLKKCIPHLIEYGEVKRGNLGVEVGNIDPSLKKKYNLKSGEGVVVLHVEEDGSCAGFLKEGDLIWKINSYDVKNNRDYEIATYDILEGEEVKIFFTREGEPNFVKVKVKRETEFTRLGIKVADINDYFLKKYNLQVRKGALIVKIKPGSFAEEMGLKEGDVIIDLNGKKIENKKDFEENIRKIKNYLQMLIIRGNTKFYLEYRLG